MLPVSLGGQKITQSLQAVIDDAATLIMEFGEGYFELPEYQLLCRILMEQTEIATNGKHIPFK